MADFTLPSNHIQEEPEFATLVSEFENMAEQRRDQVANPRRRWTLQYRNQTQAERDSFDSFFVSKRGRFSSFTWDNPNDSTTYTVRFEQDRPRYIRNGIHYDWDIQLIEVR